MKRTQRKVTLFLILLSAFYFGTSSKACPLQLEQMKTVYLDNMDFCQVYDLYHKDINTLNNMGIKDYERIADLMGPRFINLPDWNRSRQETNFNPILVYKPAPATWLSWEKGQTFMQEQIQQNITAQKIAPITIDWILKMQLEMMKDLPDKSGEFRKVRDYGLSLRRETALTQEQVLGLQQNSKSLYASWHPTLCLEDHDADFIEDIEDSRNKNKHWFYLSDWPAIDSSQFYTSEDGTKKQCGYLIYTPESEVETDMNQWVASVNNQVQLWSDSKQNDSKQQEDPLLTLAKAQRLFIQIHPFEDGNGRMSRNMLDYFILSLGLPTPIFSEMDNDIYFSDEQWASELGKGILRSLSIIKQCAEQPQTEGCNRVDRM